MQYAREASISYRTTSDATNRNLRPHGDLLNKVNLARSLSQEQSSRSFTFVEVGSLAIPRIVLFLLMAKLQETI